MQMMKKKNQKPVNDLTSGLDLKSIIHHHTLFFDKLIELIPARFYIPTDDKDKPWFQGLSKAKKASAKQQSRENIKKARRDRLDPQKSSTTTLDLLKQSLEDEKVNSEGDDDVEVEINPMIAARIEDDDDRSVTYEELRQRLRRRIEEFRSNRNCGDMGKRSERRERRENHQNKRKRNEGTDEVKEAKGGEMAKVERDASEAVKELAFSHVKLWNDEEEDGKKKKKRKTSKLKELEKAKKLEEAKKDPEKGEIIKKKHSWSAATSRAAGVKVHDDPKLLKQSIHKEKKRHDKNADKWKERTETREKMKADKQKTRSENISDRIHQKKMRRIAKREKKLMRPGFEGRKEGYINKD